MKKFSCLILMILLASNILISQNFLKLTEDALNDDFPGFMDALSVYYAIDQANDSLWIKFESHYPQTADKGFVVAFDTNLVVNDGQELMQNNLQSGQPNTSMKFDIAIYAYQTIMIPGSTFYEVINKNGVAISDLNVDVSFENNHFAILRMKLSRLTPNAELNLIAGTGSFDIIPGGSGPSDILPDIGYMSIPWQTLGAPVLILPENGAMNIDYQSVELKWLTVPDCVSYKIEYSTSPDFITNNQTYLGSDTFFTLTSLDPITNYFWRVSSYDGLNYGNWSMSSVFTTIDHIAVEEIISDSRIRIYPNPSRDQLIITGLRCCPNNYINFSLYNELGRMVMTRQLETRSANLKVSLPYLYRGKYIAEIKYSPSKSVSQVILID